MKPMRSRLMLLLSLGFLLVSIVGLAAPGPLVLAASSRSESLQAIFAGAAYDCNLTSPCNYQDSNRPTGYPLTFVLIHDVEGTAQDALTCAIERSYGAVERRIPHVCRDQQGNRTTVL